MLQRLKKIAVNVSAVALNSNSVAWEVDKFLGEKDETRDAMVSCNDAVLSAVRFRQDPVHGEVFMV